MFFLLCLYVYCRINADQLKTFKQRLNILKEVAADQKNEQIGPKSVETPLLIQDNDEELKGKFIGNNARSCLLPLPAWTEGTVLSSVCVCVCVCVCVTTKLL